jgi:hypothetical protein
MQQVELLITTDEPETAELCRLYWAVDTDGHYLHTVKELTERFDLKSGQVNDLVRKNSQAFTVNRRCPRCENGFLVQTRSEFATSHRWQESICKECKAALSAMRERQTKELEDARRAKIISTFPIVDGNPISVGDLDIKSAMALCALIRDGEQHETGIIAPLIAHSQRLAPIFDLEVELANELFEND